MSFGFRGGPLLGTDPLPVAKALTDHISGLVRHGTAAVQLRRIPITNHLLRALSVDQSTNCIKVCPDETTGVVRFDLMEEPEDYFARIRRKHQIPRRSRRLAERYTTLGPLAHDPEPNEALNALRDMLRRRSGEEPRIFRNSYLNSLTHKIATELAADGQSSISTITADGDRILVTWNLQAGSRLFGYAFAYPPELYKFSLGHLGYYLSLRQAYDAGIHEIDLDSLSGHTFKQSWTNSTAHYRTIVIVARRSTGLLANQLRRATISTHRNMVRIQSKGPSVV